MELDPTTITAKDLNGALRKAKGNSKELIEAEIENGYSPAPTRSQGRN